MATSAWPAAIRGTGASAVMSRLWLLLGCLVVGAAVGAAGWFVTGSPWWAAAIPAVLAVGWLFVADPARCLPRRP